MSADPVRDGPAADEHICGMGLFQQGSLDKVRELLNADPGVRQGWYRFEVMTWHTPAGRIAWGQPAPGQLAGGRDQLATLQPTITAWPGALFR